MIRLKKIFLSFILLTLFVSPLKAGLVFGQPSLNTPIQSDQSNISKNFRFNEDVNLKGVFGSHILFFNVDKYWEVQENNYLELYISQSEISDNNSTLTVYINDLPIYSVFLYEKEVDKDIVNIKIPKHLIKEGFNKIELKTYHRISEEFEKSCADETNPANWIVFHKESFVHLEYQEKLDTISLNDFPYPYLKQDRNGILNATIILPNQIEEEQLKAAMLLSTSFGQRDKYDNLKMHVYRYDESTSMLSKGNYIFIGFVEDTPTDFLDELTETDWKQLEEYGLIKEVTSPFNEKFKALLILTKKKNGNLLDKSIKMLAMEETVAQMNTSVQYISEENNMTHEVDEFFPATLTLEDLGYDHLLLDGQSSQTADFGIDLPENLLIDDGAQFVLKMKYADSIDYNKSLVTIHLNNTPIFSERLNRSDKDNDVIKIDIPKEIREEGIYSIKVAFHLELDDSYCDRREEGNPWAFISNQSYLYLPTKNRTKIFLENYPSPFIVNGQFNHLLFVLSDQPSIEEINILANILGFLGHELYELSDFSLIKASGFTKGYNNYNIITIGAPQENSFIKKLNDDLHLQFDKAHNQFISNDDFIILEGYGNHLSSIQLINSPFDKSQRILVLTSTERSGLLWASTYLTDFALINSLYGDTVTIDNRGHINWKYVGDVPDDKVSPNIDQQEDSPIIYSTSIKKFIIFVLMILTFLIVGSIFILRKNRR